MSRNIFNFSFTRLSVFSLFFTVFLGLVLFVISPSNAFAAGTIQRISVGINGEQLNSNSAFSEISSDGRFVLFISNDSITADDVDAGFDDVYLKDRLLNTTEKISVYPNEQGNEGINTQISPHAISDDGQFVVFTFGGQGLYLRDRTNQTTTELNIPGRDASLSGDGNHIVFWSNATNLDPNHIFQSPPDIVYAYAYDLTNNTTELVGRLNDNTPVGHSNTNAPNRGPSINYDGNYISWPADTGSPFPGSARIYVRDRLNQITEMISNDSLGNPSFGTRPSISDDGNFVAFDSTESLTPNDINNGSINDVYLFDRFNQTMSLVSQNSNNVSGDHFSNFAQISGDGNFIVYVSHASNLVPNDTNGTSGDIFLYNRVTQQNELISLTNAGTQVIQSPASPIINGDGRFVAFDSFDAYVPEDTNNLQDIYLIDRDIPAQGVDLSISMTDSPDPITPHNELTYTATVTNLGNLGATNVTFTDPLPQGPNFISASSSQGNCSGTTTIICNLGNINSGKSVTVTVVIKPMAVGTFQNTASIGSIEPDQYLFDNMVTEGTTVASAQELSKLKVAIQGNGTVTSNPAGINCQPNCLVYFYPGTQVTLTATPQPGYDFIGWAFDCAFAGTSPTCTLTADSNLTAKAKFTRR